MKVTDFTKSCLAFRREAQRLSKAGYSRIEADWRLHHGAYYRSEYKITDAIVSQDGKYIYFNTNIPDTQHLTQPEAGV